MRNVTIDGRRKGSPAEPAIAATVNRSSMWAVMPGWRTAANLIPPELLNARRLKALRRLIAGGVLVLLAACTGGYYLAARENLAAAADLAAAQDRTVELQQEGRSYSAAVAIQGATATVKSQRAQVMVGDVDLVALMGKLQNSLPATMTISSESIVISPAGVADAAVTAAGSGLDTSGLPRIGTVAVSGTGKTLNDLSDYVDRLKAVAGLVDLVPVSNTATTAGKPGTQFNLRIGMTNALLSHRFDVVGPVAK